MEDKKIHCIICGAVCGLVILTNINPTCEKCIEHGIKTPHIVEIQSPVNPGRLLYAVGETSMAITSTGSVSSVSLD